ncbi:Oidioi.mRNA.OKI2018_I69.chr2.g7662.t2.cds [Oikopleura dioica]|nr:Oidioi.mRNA.OKI2018_I69.chr2.g7662.t2.cds [Oikopleura dioica]
MWLEKDVQQLFSPKLDKFLADRFVEGTCPKPECAYEDARGDQCDKCGGLLNAIDLVNPRCKFTGCTPEIRTSKHLFLNLPKIESELKVWLNEVTSEWSNNAKQIFDSWIKKGLEPRCMTRDLKWGVKVPKEGFDHKVFYVWFDAPIGYPSITAEYTPKWRDWWQGKDVKYYQFMGKDNVPFHSVLFPSYLLGTGKPWNLVNVINATEYLNYENGKFSKSRGVGVFGNQAAETNIPSDVWRFYLIYMRPEVQDTEFQWSDFQLKNNSELLNNLGNFINRGLSFVVKFYDQKVPSAEINGNMRAWVAEVNVLLKEYIECMESNQQREGLRRVLAISKLGNKLIQTWQPWVKVKSKDPALRNEASACVMLSANLVFLLSSLLEPFMPMTSFEIARQLGVARAQIPSKFGAFLEKDHKVYESRPLFRKIEDEEVKEYRALKGDDSQKPIESSGG